MISLGIINISLYYYDILCVIIVIYNRTFYRGVDCVIFNSIKNEYDDAISRISKGDMNALSIIYTGMYKSIFKYALSIICDYNLAEDIAQETFISIAKNANTYKLGSNSRAWIYSITHNCAINMLKRRKKEISNDNLNNIETRIDEDKILSSMILIEALRYLNEKER